MAKKTKKPATKKTVKKKTTVKKKLVTKAAKKTPKKVGAKLATKKKKVTPKQAVTKATASLPAPPQVTVEIAKQNSSTPAAPIALQGQSTSIPVTNTLNVGRNAPCPCGSGKKYKKCCLV